MSTQTATVVYSPIKETLASLRSNQENFANFVLTLFDDIAEMQKKLLEVHRQLEQDREQLLQERRAFADAQQQREQSPTADPQQESELQAKIAELEQDRSALEEELESVRTRAVELSTSLTEQKREMADENARWSAELRQLRRTLDKQAAWITQQTEANATWNADNGFAPAPTPAYDTPRPANGNGGSRAHPTSFANAPQPTSARAADPVVGSILSQFEILQKDVARRREQANHNKH